MIEIPKESRNKYGFDKEKRLLKFDRMLFSAAHYPSDYGFILELGKKKTGVEGWEDRESAIQVIIESQH